MTATSAEPSTSVKRSKGFTIESIIGKDSDRQTEKQTTSREDIPPRKHTEKQTTERVKERDYDVNVNERLKPRELFNTSTSDSASNLRTSSYHQQDSSLIDSNFNLISANRNSTRTFTPPDSLKHFHEAFVHNSGNMGMGLGPVNPQTLCRHPLSALNVSGYGQHIPSPAQLHPMFMNRDIRQMYPYIDRYSGYFLPRYGGMHFFCISSFWANIRIACLAVPSSVSREECIILFI